MSSPSLNSGEYGFVLADAADSLYGVVVSVFDEPDFVFFYDEVFLIDFFYLSCFFDLSCFLDLSILVGSAFMSLSFISLSSQHPQYCPIVVYILTLFV